MEETDKMNGINSINSINLLNTDNQNTVTEAYTSGGETFKEVFDNLIGIVNETDSVNQTANYDLMTGTLENIHEATAKAAEADIALRLTVQIRNKVVDAYNEIMRMQV